MTTAPKLEDRIARDLHSTADGIAVPPRPPIAATRAGRRWTPLLVAAVVLVVVATGITLIATHRSATPASPSGTPSPSPSPSAIAHVARSAPQTPYVLDHALFVHGSRVPGSWQYVAHAGSAWVAQRTDNSWWYGVGTRAPSAISGQDVVGAPVLSPDGAFAAFLVNGQNGTTLTGFETRVGGEGIGGVPVPRTDGAGAPVNVKAVTDDGDVIVQSDGGISRMWEPYSGHTGTHVVDLSRTAPDQVVVSATTAGVVLTDGADGPAYLGDIDADGTVHRHGTLPSPEVVVDPTGRSMVWPRSRPAGEQTWIGTLLVRPVGGGATQRLTLPIGWGFAVETWSWETADTLVSRAVTADGFSRMVRCGVSAGKCVLLG